MDFLICNESVDSSKPAHRSGTGSSQKGNSFGKLGANSFFFLI